MIIGDVRPHNSIKIILLQIKSLLLPKQMIKIKKMNKTKVKIKIKIRAMIKRELCKKMREMIKRIQDHHHHLTQEFGKSCNVITPLTTYLVISRRG
jgi:hypothetical protein